MSNQLETQCFEAVTFLPEKEILMVIWHTFRITGQSILSYGTLCPTSLASSTVTFRYFTIFTLLFRALHFLP